jgi:hypothetical protein
LSSRGAFAISLSGEGPTYGTGSYFDSLKLRTEHSRGGREAWLLIRDGVHPSRRREGVGRTRGTTGDYRAAPRHWYRAGKGGSDRLGRSQQALFALLDSLAKILLTLYSRTRHTRVGSCRRKGARPARPIVEECWEGDGRRFAAGNAGVGETWRKMRSASFGSPREPTARRERRVWLRRTRSSCISGVRFHPCSAF